MLRVLTSLCVAAMLASAPDAWASSANYICAPAARVTRPAPLRGSGARNDPPKALCRNGEVPVPTPIFAPSLSLPHKDTGAPLRPGHVGAAVTANTNFFAGAKQIIVTEGVAAFLTEAQPVLATGDGLSLAEVTAESADQKQAVIVGWLVDPAVNGDSLPHLFVYHWVNGTATCFNACGWEQSSTTRRPGMVITPSSTRQEYAIKHENGAWWVWYQNEWIGRFPDTLWTSPTFTTTGLVHWLGQVNAVSATDPHSQMGNGILGSASGAAQFADLLTYDAVNLWTNASAVLSTPTLAEAYDAKVIDATHVSYGGPGAPCRPQCSGYECGDDSCGGSCGSCQAGYSCSEHLCLGGAGDTCANAIPLTPTGTLHYSGETVHATDDYSGSCGGVSGDRVFTFTLGSAANLDAHVSGFDTVMYLRSTCEDDASELACNDDVAAPDDRTSSVAATLDPGTYFLFVDGYGGETGNYSLTATFGPPCHRDTCEAVTNRCGMLPDGCGGSLSCGDCTAPMVCGGGGTPNICGTVDAGMPDAGPPDAGMPDAGFDAGPPDAGPPDSGFDAGPSDAGMPDAGLPDAGEPDAGSVKPDAGLDAGPQVARDAGVFVLPPKKTEAAAPSGCGCSPGPAGAWQLLGLMLLAARTRIRSRR